MTDVPPAAPDLRPGASAVDRLVVRLEESRAHLSTDAFDRAQVLIARMLAAAGSGDLAQIVTLQVEFDELVKG